MKRSPLQYTTSFTDTFGRPRNEIRIITNSPKQIPEESTGISLVRRETNDYATTRDNGGRRREQKIDLKTSTNDSTKSKRFEIDNETF